MKIYAVMKETYIGGEQLRDTSTEIYKVFKDENAAISCVKIMMPESEEARSSYADVYYTEELELL